jgi:hypothetical protein
MTDPNPIDGFAAMLRSMEAKRIEMGLVDKTAEVAPYPDEEAIPLWTKCLGLAMWAFVMGGLGYAVVESNWARERLVLAVLVGPAIFAVALPVAALNWLAGRVLGEDRWERIYDRIERAVLYSIIGVLVLSAAALIGPVAAGLLELIGSVAAGLVDLIRSAVAAMVAS